MTKKTKVIVAIVIIAVVAIVAIALGRGPSRSSDVALTLITWNETTLSELKGTPVVLNFWTTRCPFCRPDLHRLDAIAQQGEGEITVVAINVGESASRVQRFFGDDTPTMMVALDEQGDAFDHYASAYNNTRRLIPFTIFVDSKGIVQYARVGAFASEAELRNVLHGALGVSIP
jgi:thiol-disulfide isomerase/thioredoxin